MKKFLALLLLPLALNAQTTPINNAVIQNNSTPITGLVKANGSSPATAAVSSDISLSLDLFGNAQGDILYRGASGWTVLAPGTSGYVLSTNGASANPSWIAAATGTGSVTSVTFTGDGILDSSTPSTAVTTSGTVAATPLTQAANTILGNNTGSTALPAFNGVSSYLDNAFGNAQGDILYRGASGWTVLAPGTSGNFLETQGASANPIWAAGGGGGTPGGSNTQVQFNNSSAFAGNAGFAESNSTGATTYTQNSLGATTAVSNTFTNTTAATSSVQQYSPYQLFSGQGWKTTATAASETVQTRTYEAPASSTTEPHGLWNVDYQINGGGWNTAFQAGFYDEGLFLGGIYLPGGNMLGLDGGLAYGIYYDGSNINFVYNDVFLGEIENTGTIGWNFPTTQDATSTSSGAITTAGGISAAKQIRAGTSITATTTITAGQLYGYVGTNTNNNVQPGSIGEFITSTVASGSSVSLTTATTANVTSISLTAGDWEVSGFVDLSFSSATAVITSDQIGGISSSSATLATQDQQFQVPLVLTSQSTTVTGSIAPVRFSLASTTTIYLVAQANFSTGTASAYGTIRARRMR